MSIKGNMVFAERVKLLREQFKISQEELGAMFGYKKQAVSHWEINGKIPRDAVLKKLAQMFNVSTDYLLGNSPFPHSTTSPNRDQATVNSKTPQDLKNILQQRELMFDGIPIDDEAKKEILDIVQYQLFKRAKELNKRKP